jgi:hypothetical protein
MKLRSSAGGRYRHKTLYYTFLIYKVQVQVQVGFVCVVMLVEIFWRMGVEKKKSPDNFPRGGFNQDTYTHTDPT